MSDPTNHTNDHGHGLSHVMSIPMMLGTFAGLIALTGLTVFIAEEVELNGMDIWVAMLIATAKALLVAAFFMHLWYDKAFNVLLLIFSLFFVSLFFGATLLDSEQYEPQIQKYYNATAKTE